MTDKEKIRNEVERLMSELIKEKEKGYGSDTDDACILELQNMLTFIDSLQKEPIFKVGDTIQKKNNNSIRYSIINKTSEGYRALRGLSDTIVIWFSEQDQWKLVEEPVSEELEEAAIMHYKDVMEYIAKTGLKPAYMTSFKAGAKWQKKHLWKPADGDDLPEIDREVIALLDNGKVVFSHRPPEFWDGKDIVTGKVTRNYPKTYDKGGWNIPDVKYWLDTDLPNMED